MLETRLGRIWWRIADQLDYWLTLVRTSFFTTGFVDTVPGGYVDNTITATKYFCQLRPI
jgi:hypothetical protein